MLCTRPLHVSYSISLLWAMWNLKYINNVKKKQFKKATGILIGAGYDVSTPLTNSHATKTPV